MKKTVVNQVKNKTDISVSRHPYSSFIHRVGKPARYLGGEYQSIIKDQSRVQATMALCFPDLYDIGMSHLGMKILYSILNKQEDLCVERAFCPWPDMEEELRSRNLPILTLETHRPLRQFDVVGFSLQYEMTYTNVLTMLELGGIPIRAGDRTLEDPLVIAGGPNVTQPEPMAPFMDVFLVGDAEERLPRLLRHYSELKQAGGRSREEILAELAREGGLYCPALYTRKICERSGLMVVDRPKVEGVPEKIERAFVEDISRYRFPDDSPVAAAEAVFDRMSIEIARGCTEGCRFCQAGMIYRPVRERDPGEIIDTLLSAIDKGGYDEAALTCLSTADYSCISPLIKQVMERLRQRKIGLGISSLRAYGLDEDLLGEIATVKATGLTFAPESGAQRMRDVINKNISEEDIFTTCHRVFSRGWDRMKLYFMIGLPTEEDEDVRGIAEMGRQAVQIGREYLKNKKPNVTVSVSSHVPKPHTPFQWCAMDTLEEISRKQDMLDGLTRRYKLNFRWHDYRISHLEGILSRGDIRTGDLIEKVWRKGARFDGWDEKLRWDLWQEALEEFENETGVHRRLYLDTIPVDARLPWDHIDVDLTEDFLLKEYQRALKNRLSPPCGKPSGAKVHHTNLEDARADERKLICYSCGVACDLTKMREERIEFLEKLGAEKRPEQRSGDNERSKALERINKGMTPHDFKQGEKVRYRMKYTKLGPVTLQGHLDMIRILPRIFRRAKLPLYYSEGYSPKPVMAFSPALSLGMASRAEYVDFALYEDLPVEEVFQCLAENTEPGIEILGVRQLGQGKALAKVLHAMDYTVELPSSFNAAEGESRIKEIESNENFSVEVIRKRKRREVRLWDCVDFLKLNNCTVLPLAKGELEGVGENPRLQIRLLQKEGASLKPAEIVRVLFGIEINPSSVTRTACISLNDEGGAVDPLDVV